MCWFRRIYTSAFLGGANGIELCSSLIEGRLTPSYGLIISVLKNVSNIVVQIMIRPRSGDFCFNENEMEIIKINILQIIN